MNSSLTLDTITRSLQVLQKILNIHEDAAGARQSDEAGTDRIAVMKDTLITISDLLSSSNSGPFNDAIQKSNEYSTAYRDIKSRMTRYRGRTPDLSQLIETIRAIVPVLQDNQKIYLDKIVKIFDIINS